jgi:DNA adenine methylase
LETLVGYERPRAFPFLKWAGGKKKLLGELERRMPTKFAAYHEPFVGGGALFFDLYAQNKVRRATISDLNRDLINAYLAIRDNLEQLLKRLENLQAHAKDRSFYYHEARRRFNEIKLKKGEEGDVEKAALLFYLNKTCYNGLYRVNSEGGFNVPWGGYKNPKIFDEGNLLAVSAVLNETQIGVKCSDFSVVKDTAKRGDFVYFDPPYQPISRTASFAEYTPQSFGKDDQERLSNLFHELSSAGCHLMLSNSPKVKSLYEGHDYNIASIKASRAINCVGSKRGPIDELLVTNY